MCVGITGWGSLACSMVDWLKQAFELWKRAWASLYTPLDAADDADLLDTETETETEGEEEVKTGETGEKGETMTATAPGAPGAAASATGAATGAAQPPEQLPDGYSHAKALIEDIHDTCVCACVRVDCDYRAVLWVVP